jgi:hypothetical protein
LPHCASSPQKSIPPTAIPRRTRFPSCDDVAIGRSYKENAGKRQATVFLHPGPLQNFTDTLESATGGRVGKGVRQPLKKIPQRPSGGVPTRQTRRL